MTELKGLLENKPCFIVLEKPQLIFSIIQQDGEKIKVKSELNVVLAERETS